MKKQIVRMMASVILVVAFSVGASAGASLPKTLTDAALLSLTTVRQEQIAQANATYEAGEWPTRIDSTLVPIMVGVGKPFGHDQEATAFTTAAVANELASIYLANPELRASSSMAMIPDLLTRAVDSFARYREGDLFNFYPPRIWRGIKVRQPIDMTLGSIWKGFTNIPEDADTSSSVYTTLLYEAALRGQRFQIPTAALASFEKYRDLNRKPHYYNRSEKTINSGAYMTWQMDEYDRAMPRAYFARPEAGVRIPFNRNDVDCIVNLNVLRMLALDGSAPSEGRDRACRTINTMIEKSQHATCGIYYPNTFNLAFSAANATSAGETCITKRSRSKTIDFILKSQNADGGWKNDRNIWIDRVQSTAFAMTALLEFGDPNDRATTSALRYGTAFLLRNAQLTRSGLPYWKGEVFFTATAIARSLVVWRSQSFTTAVVANVLLKMQKHSPEWSVPAYLGIN